MSEADREGEVCILELGAEGGGYQVWARPCREGEWEYRIVTVDALFRDLLSDEDLPETPPTLWTPHWHEVLRRLDRRRWVRLLPLHLDHRFRERVLDAVASRIQGEPPGVVARWEELRNS